MIIRNYPQGNIQKVIISYGGNYIKVKNRNGGIIQKVNIQRGNIQKSKKNNYSKSKNSMGELLKNK